MLDFLCCGDEREVGSNFILLLAFFDDLFAFLDQAGHGAAGFRLRFLSQIRECLIEPLYVLLGLREMLLESFSEPRVVRRLGHLRECFRELHFGMQQILQFLNEQFF
jgi:hypothetical protein